MVKPKTTRKHPPPPGTARLAIDVPVSLHSRIKSLCAQRGQTLRAGLTEVLERSFPRGRSK